MEVGERDAPEEEEEEGGGGPGEGNMEDENVEKKLETQEEEEVTIFKPKMKEFPGTAEVIGLRIRAGPSFLVGPTGLLNKYTFHLSLSLSLYPSPFLVICGSG